MVSMSGRKSNQKEEISASSLMRRKYHRWDGLREEMYDRGMISPPDQGMPFLIESAPAILPTQEEATPPCSLNCVQALRDAGFFGGCPSTETCVLYIKWVEESQVKG